MWFVQVLDCNVSQTNPTPECEVNGTMALWFIYYTILNIIYNTKTVLNSKAVHIREQIRQIQGGTYSPAARSRRRIYREVSMTQRGRG